MSVKGNYEVSYETIVGLNPRTKEEIKFNRNYYKYNNYTFYADNEKIQKYESVQLTREELGIITEATKDYLSSEFKEEIDDEDLLKLTTIVELCLKDTIALEEKVIVLAYLNDTMLNYYCDFTDGEKDLEFVKSTLGDLYSVFSKVYCDNEGEVE